MDDDAPPGVPEWVVTYGDMMSLLLTFFIMLVSLSEVVADQKFRAVLESLQQTFGYRHGPSSPPGKHFPLNAVLENLTTLGSFTETPRGHGGVKTESVPGNDSRMLRNREGDGLPVGESIEFPPGSDVPRPGYERNLDEIALRLAGYPNKVEIRGLGVAPTENVPRGDDDPNGAVTDSSASLQLDYRRARFVRDRLARAKVDPDRLRLVVAGDGGQRADDEAGLLRSPDRVEVYVLDTRVEEFVGAREGH